MKKILISIILPVYNAEKYLSRCLDSLINSKYANLEIICIDDGSTDNSLNILRHYQNKDNRIKVIHQSNVGPGVTRNNGLDIVTGDYIIFIDADDWVDKEMFNLMIQKQIEFDADICCCNVAYVYEDKQEDCIPVIKDGLIGNDLAMKFVGYDSFNNCLWNKLFKKQLLDGFKLIPRFLGDDYDAVVRLVSKAKKIYYIGQVLYFYFKGKHDSITTNHFLNEKATQDYFYTCRKCLDHMKKKQFFSALPIAKKRLIEISILRLIYIYTIRNYLIE